MLHGLDHHVGSTDSEVSGDDAMPRRASVARES
jgi:hypothetical protein